MARMDEFARDWSYRGPLKTISYHKGYKGVLEPDVQMAARKARALVPPKRRKAAE